LIPEYRLWQLYQSGDYDAAITACQQSLGQDPENPTTHQIMAYCFAQKRERKLAIAAAEKAVALDPDDEELQMTLAHIAADFGLYKQAMETCNLVLSRDPNYASAHAMCAVILANTGKRKEALVANARALELEPESAGMHNLRAELLRLGKDKEGALAASNEALRLQPDNADYHTTRSRILRSGPKSADSIRAMRESMRLDPTDTDNREELLEAYRARFPLYRWLYSFHEWSAGLEGAWRYVPFIGFYLLAQVGRRLFPPDSPWRWVFAPFAVLYVLFLFTVYYAPIILDALMAVDKQVRHFLTREQRRGVLSMCSCLVVGLIFLCLSPVGSIFSVLAGLELLFGFVLGGLFYHISSFPGRFNLLYGWAVATHAGVVVLLLSSLFS
jgi:tetratricopeptide (TPR) repeat protein